MKLKKRFKRKDSVNKNEKKVIISFNGRNTNRNFMTAAKKDSFTIFVNDEQLEKLKEFIAKINLSGWDVIESYSMEIES